MKTNVKLTHDMFIQLLIVKPLKTIINSDILSKINARFGVKTRIIM